VKHTCPSSAEDQPPNLDGGDQRFGREPGRQKPPIRAASGPVRRTGRCQCAFTCSWRWGESNPRPERHQRRHLRAQPTASFRNMRTLSASTLVPYPESSFPSGPGTPEGASHIALPRPAEVGTQQGDRSVYLRCQCVTFVCTCVCSGSLTRTPETSARFRRLNSHGRNHVTPAHAGTCEARPRDTGYRGRTTSHSATPPYGTTADRPLPFRGDR